MRRLAALLALVVAVPVARAATTGSGDLVFPIPPAGTVTVTDAADCYNATTVEAALAEVAEQVGVCEDEGPIANTIYAGPASGPAADAAFRWLVEADLPVSYTAPLATALAADPSNCPPDDGPTGAGGIAADGTAQGCFSPALAGAVTTSLLEMSSGRILGRTTASTGAVEELTATAPLAVAAGALSIGDVALGSGTSGSYAAGDAEAGNATGLVCTTCVGASDLAADSVTEPKLDALNLPSDDYCLTYDLASARLNWQECAPGVGTPLEPDELGEPIYTWWRTTGPFWEDGARTDAAEPSDVVAAWDDSSGNGLHAFWPGGGVQSLITDGGRYGVVIGDDGGHLSTTTGAASLSGDWTMFVVVRMDVAQTRVVMMWGDEASGERRSLITVSGEAVSHGQAWFSGYIAGNVGSKCDIAYGTHGVVIVRASTTVSLYVDGELCVSGTSSLNAYAAAEITLGSNTSGTEPCKLCRIFEAGTYANDLAGADLDALNAYVAALAGH